MSSPRQPLCRLHNPGLVGIEQAPLVIGLGPPDLVAGVNVEGADFEQAQRILFTLRPDLTGTKLELAATLVLQRDSLAPTSVPTTRYSPAARPWLR
jgi:hypothetical protein